MPGGNPTNAYDFKNNNTFVEGNSELFTM